MQMGSIARFRLRLRRWRLWVVGLIGLGLIFGLWFTRTAIVLQSAASKPVDAFFVLGGSIRREIYVAALSKQFPDVPILISRGSPDPCILLIFQRTQADLQNVWLEKCASSTFTNLYFGLPILQQWHVHKVQLITSQTHLPRALWLAQILLGSHGIWVDLAVVPEQGVPGNEESWLKTGVDVARGLTWAVISQFHTPKCTQVVRLSDVNLNLWQQSGFRCEYQGQVRSDSVLKP